MKSALKSAAIAFALTAGLMQTNLLPSGWGRTDAAGFEARHANENAAKVAAELRLDEA